MPTTPHMAGPTLAQEIARTGNNAGSLRITLPNRFGHNARPETPMIDVKGLTKYYGDHAAVRDLTFTIGKGEIIGFLGLNGDRKSTALKILGCVLLPTAGAVTVDGIDIARDPHEVRRRIGFLPDTPPPYHPMSLGRD